MDRLTQAFSSLPNAVVAGALLLGGLYMFISLLRRGFRMASGKLVKTSATVTAKYPREREWIVAFDTGGLVLRFPVPRAVYDRVEVGDRGRLRYRGAALVSFHGEEAKNSHKGPGPTV